MSWRAGPILLATGEERTISYWWGARETPEWHGPQVAVPGPSMSGGGAGLVATAQGSRNVGSDFDQTMQYLVTIKNHGAAGSFYLHGGGLA